MNESMIERVARAIARTQSGSLFREECTAVQLDAFGYIAAARAAIEAMRGPTKPMVEAGAVSCGEDSEATAIGAWEGMIDAALTEHANAR